MPHLLVLKEPAVIGGELSWLVASQVGAVAGQAERSLSHPPQRPTDPLFGQIANACGDYVVEIRNFADMQQRIAMGRSWRRTCRAARRTGRSSCARAGRSRQPTRSGCWTSPGCPP